MSLPSRILVQIGLTVLLLWWMTIGLPAYVAVTGGWPALLILAIILVFLNMIVRPVLNLVLLPIKLLAGILAILIANGVFLWLLLEIAKRMDPRFVTFEIRGGIVGWIVVAIVLGIANALFHVLLRPKRD